MLSNCEDCKYLGEGGCAVNISHWTVWQLINSKRPLLNESTKSAIASNAQSCQDFQVAEDLQIIHAPIGLPLRTWRKIAESGDVGNDYEPLVNAAKTVLTTSERYASCSDSELKELLG
jgi:hypothetical protein